MTHEEEPAADQYPEEHATLSAPPTQEKPATHGIQELTSVDPVDKV